MLRAKGTCRVKTTSTRPKIVVSADGRGVVGHAGTRLVADLADATGLSVAVSDALAPLRRRASGHDPGRALFCLSLSIPSGVHGLGMFGGAANYCRDVRPVIC